MEMFAVFLLSNPLGYNYKDFHTLGGGGVWSYEIGLREEDKSLGIFDTNREQAQYGNCRDSSSPCVMQNIKEWDHHNSSPDAGGKPFPPALHPPPETFSGRRKRRRSKSCKNKEEVENQRMTHIAVERNRRKQMNEYLSVLRSLMPASYVQRGDQASIIGGAINFVKELEHLLQTREAQKKTKQQPPPTNIALATSPFADFFTFPQYSTRAAQGKISPAVATATANESSSSSSSTADNKRWAAVADIEVTMVESHANLKIFSKKRPKQLLNMVAGFQCLRLSILHLNVTTLDQMVLYSVSVKVEDGCQLTTVDDIASAVNQMLQRIQEEALLT
nr:basic helix-loop-helix transcription factor [Loropetalum chinense var. rubrum]